MLEKERTDIEQEIKESRPKLVTLMMMNNCSKYLVDKEIYVNS